MCGSYDVDLNLEIHSHELVFIFYFVSEGCLDESTVGSLLKTMFFLSAPLERKLLLSRISEKLFFLFWTEAEMTH